MRSILVRLCLLVSSLFCYSATGLAQYDYLPQVGIKNFATYQESNIDSVDLDTGNVNLHLPLLSFPQKGNRLRLAFIVRYNEPQWLSVIGPPQAISSGYSATGFWKIQTTGDPRPIGVDVVRDQGVTNTSSITTHLAPGWGYNGDPVEYSPEVGGIRDRSGASHSLLVKPNTNTSPNTVSFPAPDGSGWRVGESGLQDSAGVRYNSFTIHPGAATLQAWNVSDAHNNVITTDVDGWHDSMGRYIPGSWNGHGAGAINSPAGSAPAEDDPFPGVPSNEMARCNNGAVATRTWTIPSSSDSGGSQTYYFCFSKYTAHTHFNFSGQLGAVTSATLTEASFDAYLLSKIILPNGTVYSFQYDPNYLDLTQIGLPTGGSIAYTWATVNWDYCSTALPKKRVVTLRTVTSGNSTSSWSYNWGAGGVCNPQPGDAMPVIVSKPDQNDEWHYGGLNKTVIYYKGHTGGNFDSPTGTISKIVQTTRSQRATPLFTQTQDILVNSTEVDQYGVPIAQWIHGYSIPQMMPGPVEKTLVALYDTDTQQVSSSQETDTTPIPSSGSIERWNPDNYWYPTHDTCACINYTEIATAKVYDVVQGSSTGPGTLLRQTTTGYRFQDTGGQAYADAGLTGLPSSVTVLDDTGSQAAAKTTYQYDEASYSAGAVAGEPTTTQRWAGGTNWISSHTKFDASGVFAGSLDPMGTATTVTAYDCSNAFPSSVTVAAGTPLAESVSYVHDCNTGVVTSHVDANGQPSYYTYADPLNRITAVHNPDGGSVQVGYTDGSNASVTIATATGSPQGPMSQTVAYDLLGRTVDVQTRSGLINV